jgi:hypothetical protein
VPPWPAPESIRFSVHAPRAENSYIIAESHPARRPVRKVSSGVRRKSNVFWTHSEPVRCRLPRLRLVLDRELTSLGERRFQTTVGGQRRVHHSRRVVDMAFG